LWAYPAQSWQCLATNDGSPGQFGERLKGYSGTDASFYNGVLVAPVFRHDGDIENPLGVIVFEGETAARIKPDYAKAAIHVLRGLFLSTDVEGAA
ncbi:MAG: hypothetical protein ACXWPM_09480, partial [Bdellovibrionota bacterium]